ncbi:hypothetical protein [Enterobacter bugandensis]|nr:hypothetical protein [Enterobacter bugandensis]
MHICRVIQIKTTGKLTILAAKGHALSVDLFHVPEAVSGKW